MTDDENGSGARVEQRSTDVSVMLVSKIALTGLESLRFAEEEDCCGRLLLVVAGR